MKSHQASLMRPPAAKAAARSLPLLFVFVVSCGEAPTQPARSCVLASPGATLAMTPPTAASLQPLLDDARTRLIPALTTPVPALANAMSTLQGHIAVADAVSSCEIFNGIVRSFEEVAAAAPLADTPDLEAIRLVLRLVHVRLSAN